MKRSLRFAGNDGLVSAAPVDLLFIVFVQRYLRKTLLMLIIPGDLTFVAILLARVTLAVYQNIVPSHPACS